MKNNRLLPIIMLAGLLGALFVFSTPCRADDLSRLRTLRPYNGGPGAEITLCGEGFGDTVGKSKVFFGSVEARVVSWSSREVTALVPNDVDPKDLVEAGGKRRKGMFIPIFIQLGDGNKTESRHFDILPHIKRISPNQGGAGEKVTVTGENFGNFIDLGQVFVGSTPAQIVTWSARKIEIIMPDQINPDQVQAEKDRRGKVRFRKIDIFVQAGKIKGEGEGFQWDPVISSVKPEQAGPDYVVEIRGKNFGVKPSSIKVFFGSHQVTPDSIQQDGLRARIPAGIAPTDLENGKLPVTVVAGGVESNSLTLVVAPHINAVHPAGSKGGEIIITGNNFGALQRGNRVVFKTDASGVSEELEAQIKAWDNDEIKVEIPMDTNKTASDVIYKVKVISGKFQSNEKDFSCRSSMSKKEKQALEEKKAVEEKKTTEDKPDKEAKSDEKSSAGDEEVKTEVKEVKKKKVK